MACRPVSTTNAAAHFNWPRSTLRFASSSRVQAQFLAQGRRIQGPAVDEGRIGAEPPKLGQVGPRLLQRGLIVPSRDRLLHETGAVHLRPPHPSRRRVHVQNRRPSARCGGPVGKGVVARVKGSAARTSKSTGGAAANRPGMAARIWVSSSRYPATSSAASLGADPAGTVPGGCDAGALEGDRLRRARGRESRWASSAAVGRAFDQKGVPGGPQRQRR